jgi:hypothetical protein
VHLDAIAEIQFADGRTRDVFEDARGQYVFDDNAEPVYGVWFIPEDAPDLPPRITGPILVADRRHEPVRGLGR